MAKQTPSADQFRKILDEARDYHDNEAALFEAHTDEDAVADLHEKKARIYEDAARQIDALSSSDVGGK